MADDPPPNEPPPTGWMRQFPDNPPPMRPRQTYFEEAVWNWSPPRGNAVLAAGATTAEAFAAMQERIRVLEIAISRMPPPPAGLGHNNPPEPIEDVPITSAEWGEIPQLLEVVKQQPVVPAQAPTEAIAAARTLRGIGERVLSYLGRHFEEFSSEFSKKLGASAGIWVVANYGNASLHSFADDLINLYSQVEAWVHSLGF
jgi:hypothetical protein